MRVRVPASSANLGPGFDALGLALGVYLTCRFRLSDTLEIRAAGRDCDTISTGPDNMIWLTAGVVIADQLLDLRWKPLRILDEAARLEGHPDNVAPCALGSIVASAIDSGGVVRSVRLDLPQRFGIAIVVPDFDLPTAKARAVLPACYTREDAVFNVQRAALLMAALATGSTWAFPVALEDRFHQPYRAPLVPGLEEI